MTLNIEDNLRESNKILKRILLLVMGIIIVCSVILCFFLIDPFRTIPSMVLIKFAKALINKNKSTAYSLSSPDIWDEIDEWINNSENGPVECSFLDSLDNDFSYISVCSRPDTTLIQCSYFEQCWPIHYEFHIDQVELSRKGISWEVVDIESICESWNYECDP